MSQVKAFRGFGSEPYKKSSDYERRTEARYPLEMEVIVFSGKDFVHARTVNVSPSGLQLAVPLPQKFRDSHVEIAMTDEYKIQPRSEVILGQVVDDSGTHIRLDTPFENLD